MPQNTGALSASIIRQIPSSRPTFRELGTRENAGYDEHTFRVIHWAYLFPHSLRALRLPANQLQPGHVDRRSFHDPQQPPVSPKRSGVMRSGCINPAQEACAWPSLSARPARAGVVEVALQKRWNVQPGPGYAIRERTGGCKRERQRPFKPASDFSEATTLNAQNHAGTTKVSPKNTRSVDVV